MHWHFCHLIFGPTGQMNKMTRKLLRFFATCSTPTAAYNSLQDNQKIWQRNAEQVQHGVWRDIWGKWWEHSNKNEIKIFKVKHLCMILCLDKNSRMKTQFDMTRRRIRRRYSFIAGSRWRGKYLIGSNKARLVARWLSSLLDMIFWWVAGLPIDCAFC